MFFDLKLHDIGNTVNKGVESIVHSGATFLTVHAYPQTMKAALDASRGSKLKILAVTILTSYNDSDVTEAGYVGSAREQVEKKSLQACALGIDGIVCSAEESAMLRPLIGPDRLLVTPGIRPAGAETRRPEADHDARCGDQGGLGLSRGRPSDHRRRRSEGGGGRDRSRSRAGDEGSREEAMAKGYWIATCRCVQRRWLQALCCGQPCDLQEVRRPLHHARRQVRMSWKAKRAAATW